MKIPMDPVIRQAAPLVEKGRILIGKVPPRFVKPLAIGLSVLGLLLVVFLARPQGLLPSRGAAG